MEGEKGRKSADDPRSRDSSSTWGQFDASAVSGVNSWANTEYVGASNEQAMAIDEDDMLLLGMSSPQVAYEGERSQSPPTLHKSPKEKELNNSCRLIQLRPHPQMVQ